MGGPVRHVRREERERAESVGHLHPRVRADLCLIDRVVHVVADLAPVAVVDLGCFAGDAALEQPQAIFPALALALPVLERVAPERLHLRFRQPDAAGAADRLAGDEARALVLKCGVYRIPGQRKVS